jgi:hypothetical protein
VGHQPDAGSLQEGCCGLRDGTRGPVKVEVRER